MGDVAFPQLKASDYNRLIDAFSEAGPVFSKVVEITGISKETCRKAWVWGWPKRGWRAIKDLDLEDPSVRLPPEAPGDHAHSVTYGHDHTSRSAKPLGRRETGDHMATYGHGSIDSVTYGHDHTSKSAEFGESSASPRATADKRHDSGRQTDVVPPPTLTPSVAPLLPKTVEDALALLAQERATALVQEQRLIRGARDTLTGFVVSIHNMLAMYQPAIKAMEKRMQTEIETNAKGGHKSVLRDFDKMARMVPRIVNSTKAIMEMQRLLMGMPQSITEQRTTSPEDEGRGARLASIFAAERTRVIDVHPVGPYAGEETSSEEPVTSIAE